MINKVCEKCNHYKKYICDAHWNAPLENTLYDTISKLDDCLYLNQNKPRLYQIWFNVLLEDDSTETLDMIRVFKNTQDVKSEISEVSKFFIGQELCESKIKSVISTKVDVMIHADGYDIELKERNE